MLKSWKRKHTTHHRDSSVCQRLDFTMVVSNDLKQHQVEINFLHPKGPSTSFTFPRHPDQRLVDLGDVMTSMSGATHSNRQNILSKSTWDEQSIISPWPVASKEKVKLFTLSPDFALHILADLGSLGWGETENHKQHQGFMCCSTDSGHNVKTSGDVKKCLPYNIIKWQKMFL